MNFKELNEQLQKYIEIKETLSQEDIDKAEVVTLDNLHQCYNDMNRNLYTKFSPDKDFEVIDGFEESEVADAIKNGSPVICF